MRNLDFSVLASRLFRAEPPLACVADETKPLPPGGAVTRILQCGLVGWYKICSRRACHQRYWTSLRPAVLPIEVHLHLAKTEQKIFYVKGGSRLAFIPFPIKPSKQPQNYQRCHFHNAFSISGIIFALPIILLFKYLNIFYIFPLTGPLLEENMSVLDIPQKQRTDLAVHLCGKSYLCTMLLE